MIMAARSIGGSLPAQVVVTSSGAPVEGGGVAVVGVDPPPLPAEGPVAVVVGWLVVLDGDPETAVVEVRMALARVAVVPGEMPGLDRPPEVALIVGAVIMGVVVPGGPAGVGAQRRAVVVGAARLVTSPMGGARPSWERGPPTIRPRTAPASVDTTAPAVHHASTLRRRFRVIGR
jgi:hypothetical protein